VASFKERMMKNRSVPALLKRQSDELLGCFSSPSFRQSNTASVTNAIVRALVLSVATIDHLISEGIVCPHDPDDETATIMRTTIIMNADFRGNSFESNRIESNARPFGVAGRERIQLALRHLQRRSTRSVTYHCRKSSPYCWPICSPSSSQEGRPPLLGRWAGSGRTVSFRTRAPSRLRPVPWFRVT
jgi:hypothetical protein